VIVVGLTVHLLGCITENLLEYAQIGNVGFSQTNVSVSRNSHFQIVLVLRNGQLIQTDRTEMGSSLARAIALEWYRFLFGMQNPAAYVPLLGGSLVLR